MHCRRHGTKPTIAFWMLVAVADAALLVASVGVMALLLALGIIATAVAAATGVWSWRRGFTRPHRIPAEAVTLRTRRRA